jgi:hypothetical protein
VISAGIIGFWVIVEEQNGIIQSDLKSGDSVIHNQFHHKCIRDLAWVMASPAVLDWVSPLQFESGVFSNRVVGDGRCQSWYLQNVQWLMTLDEHPQPLLKWLQQRSSRRLGYYFEDLLAYWLTQTGNVSYFARHVQLRDNTKTLGEFDCLFKQHGSSVLYHWEAAVKFYLRHIDNEGRFHWYGPNSQDRFDLKMERLFNHQLQLTVIAQALEPVPEITFSEICPQAFVKGFLFYPAEQDWRTPDPIPPQASIHHSKGWWTRAGIYQVPNVATDSKWCVLTRLNWLTTPYFSASDRHLLLDKKQLIDYCNQYFNFSPMNRPKPPILVAELALDENDNYLEQSRGFIVGPHWP